MLNELYSIYRGLEAVGESPEIRHKEIQEPGAGNTTFRVMLDKNGQVSSVRLMLKEQIQHCWTMGNGNHNQFPAIKVTVPLLPEGHNDYLRWKKEHSRPKETDYRNLIESISREYLTAIAHIDIWPKYRKKILAKKERLHSCDGCEAVYELLDRYSKAETGVEILDQICTSLVELSRQETDMSILKAICALLLGEKLNEKGEVESEGNHRVTLLLDCFPDDEIDIYASSRDHVSALSQVLFELESGKTKKSIEGECSLIGEKAKLVSDKFYNAKLASFMSPILFAKSETSGPTVRRYGRSGVKAYSMSETLGRELAGSIEFITSDKFKNKTWAKLPTSSLLVAYCKNNWSLPFTALVTGESEIEDFDDYLDAADSVLALFKGKDVSLDAVVDFIEIIKVNDGNHKVNFSTTAKIAELIHSAEQWKQACQNSPSFKLYAQVHNNEKQMCVPWAISPQQIMYLSRQKFIRDGGSSTAIPGISFSDVMKIFLRKNNHDLVSRCLQRISEQCQPLFNSCASSRLQKVLPNSNVRVKTNLKNNTQLLSIVTLMTLLLFKMERKKEVYMNDFAFQLGQLCSAMDELHIGYCKSERKGDIPSTLIGNQVYGMALQDPDKAMGFMASRIRPYDSWAKRMRAKDVRPEDKAITAAIFAQIWMSKQAKSLNGFLSNFTVKSDTYKSELMLGYLTGRPFEEKNTSKNNQGGKS